MSVSDYGLSPSAQQLVDAAVEKCRREIRSFGRIRTSFFTMNEQSAPEFQEFRDFMDRVIREFGMDTPFNDRESDYSQFVNNKFFDILSMQLHREHPEAYLVSTQSEDGKIIFIIRDRSALPYNNLKLVWKETSFQKANFEKIPFHLNRADLI